MYRKNIREFEKKRKNLGHINKNSDIDVINIKRKALNSPIKTLVIIIFLAALIFAVFKITMYLNNLYNSNRYNEQLAEEVVSKSRNNTYEINFNLLQTINTDTIGWIKFNNDKINNPIVKSDDNEEYLIKSYEKENNNIGTIFMDYRNRSFTDRNVILYGRNIPNGSMFGSLKDAFKESFYDNGNNKYIKIITSNNENLTYEIFSYYIVEKEDDNYLTTTFRSDNEFSVFVNNLKNKSDKEFDTTVTKNDKILTLSTDYGISKRRVIHAKRVLK